MKPPVASPSDGAPKGRSGRAHVPSAQTLSRQALVHELQVHQVELEQQNEELRAAQRDLALARDRYVDLFDFAPVGYLTLDWQGCIAEANLTVAAELGVARDELLGRPLLRFIVPADGERWQRLQAVALRRDDPKRIELRLRRNDGREFHAQLDCLRVPGPAAKAAQLRVTITDVSQRKLAETNRRIAISGSLAREAERRRVAHGLHEDLGQRLIALKIALADMVPPAAAASMRAAADSMAAQLDEAVAAVRRMSSELHPLILENLGLTAALDWLVRDVAARRGLVVEQHLDDDILVDEATAIATYRLAETVLEQLAQHVSAGVSMELLKRRHDLVLQFQCEPGHTRPDAQVADLTETTESLKDQIHLLAGRLELDEPAPGLRRISIFLPMAAPAAR